MNNRIGKNGFTLMEVLVAAALIVTIVSMVYGSYFATSKSACIYEARIAQLQQGRKVLEQMARQIRCLYTATTMESAYPAADSQFLSKASEELISYFDANPNDPDGKILYLVTTSAISQEQQRPEGLFEVTYKFDKSRGMLFLNQSRFVGSSKSAVGKEKWQNIASDINYLELSFFDGQEWFNNWDYKYKKKTPCAVKIEIGCEGENNRQLHYGTIAYVSCSAIGGVK